MTKQELISEMKQRGYNESEFFSDLTDSDYQKWLNMISAGQTAQAWEDIEKTHDEIIFFSLFGDDAIIAQTV